ncbi:MAG: DMT family transporter [Acidiferrobacteraceae bacterium]|jgi:drug/metabolite transporter (DMT)-like permease|nr:DMT family transporter [Acidiferrobacteraceae bacterium]MBT7182846.1 DMT family transporter [Acidiferrobacteraceae bacterium]MBT7354169.1 DMT family transporter [Acidiferrobacteraceae bacterium]
MAEGVDLDQGFYRSATLVGFTAILMWSLLAALTVATGAVPPFQLAAVCFAIGGALGLIWTGIRGELRLLTGQPLSVWLHGVGGIFGYHFFYFTALRHGSPAEASLIAYLWPLLIVLFSAALPGHRLKVHHVAGAVLGLAGVAVIVLGRGRGLIITEPVGYLAAGACALIWSAYSVSNRIFSKVPTSLVTGFCLVSSFLAGICHLLFEQTLWPQTALAWWSVLGLGVGPVGLAFFVWDYGCKRGDLRVLGAGAYLAPLLSTAALLALGLESPRLSIIVAAFLITGGAMIAARDLIRRRSSASG